MGGGGAGRLGELESMRVLDTDTGEDNTDAGVDVTEVRPPLSRRTAIAVKRMIAQNVTRHT